MIEYNPEDVPEENTFQPFPVGEYEAEVIEATVMKSKAGNEMIRLNLAVVNDKGNSTRIYDYIVIPNTLFKLKSICRCLNMEFSGTLDEQELVSQRLKIKLGIDKGDENYSPKNKVDRYVDGISADSAPAEATPLIPDDDVPF